MLTPSLNTKLFSHHLLIWFKRNGRHSLPWQESFLPYPIWVSEIMLQQTQVITVIPYFKKFLTRFSSVDALAQASQDDVLSLWSGLGFYSRARNLHQCAKVIVREHQGQFPKTLKELYALPGIGKTTAHAIYSLAFNKKAPILDGNVKRVLIRYFALQAHSNDRHIQTDLWEKADFLMPKTNARAYTQAIMDLGALICTPKNPKCLQCPLSKSCQAHLKKLSSQLPLKKKTVTKPTRELFFLLIHKDESILLKKKPEKGIWGGLWSLPEIETDKGLNEFLKLIGNATVTPLEPFKHTFSHYHLILKPIKLSIKGKSLSLPFEEAQWHLIENVSRLGLPKPIQTLLTPLASAC